MTKCSTGCGKNAAARGLCRGCYQRARRAGTLADRPKATMGRAGRCGFPGCGLNIKARGWCTGHYRQQAAGEKLRPLWRPQPKPQRIVMLCSVDGCGRVLRASTNTTGLCVDHAPAQYDADRRALLAGAWFEQVRRRLVWLRDGGTCHLCGLPAGEDWQLEHVIPLAAGGAHSYQNTAVAHPRCNQSKRDRLAPSALGLLGAYSVRPAGCTSR